MRIKTEELARIARNLRDAAKRAIEQIEDSHNCWNLEPTATIQARKNAVELFDGLAYLTSVLEICEDESEEPVSPQGE